MAAAAPLDLAAGKARYRRTSETVAAYRARGRIGAPSLSQAALCGLAYEKHLTKALRHLRRCCNDCARRLCCAHTKTLPVFCHYRLHASAPPYAHSRDACLFHATRALYIANLPIKTTRTFYRACRCDARSVGGYRLLARHAHGSRHQPPSSMSSSNGASEWRMVGQIDGIASATISRWETGGHRALRSAGAGGATSAA